MLGVGTEVESSLDLLPDAVLLEIFRSLPFETKLALPQVSKRWQRICGPQSDLWEVVEVDFLSLRRNVGNAVMPGQAVPCLQLSRLIHWFRSRRDVLKHLSLTGAFLGGWTNLRVGELSSVYLGLQNLVSLTIDDCTCFSDGNLAELQWLSNLKTLNLKEAWSDENFPDFGQLSHLVWLENLSLCYKECGLGDELPEGFWKLTGLKNLSLEGALSCELFSAGFGSLVNLEHLTILDTNTALLPDELSMLTSLRKLCMREFYLESVAPIQGLTQLLSLSMSRIAYPIIAADLICLVNLVELYLFVEDFGDGGVTVELGQLGIPPDFDVILPGLRRLQKLKLEGFQFKQFPRAILELHNLEELSLARNALTQVPASEILEKLPNLKVLDVSGCPIEAVAFR